MKKNRYLIEGFNSLYLTTLHDGDIIKPIEYEEAIKQIKPKTIWVIDENNKYKKLKTESFLSVLSCYSCIKSVKCYFKKDICKFYPIMNNLNKGDSK